MVGLLFVVWSVLAFSLSVPAAEVPAVDKLLADIANGRERLHTLEAVYEFQRPRENINSDNRILVAQTVYYRAPDRIRLNLSRPGREEVFLAANMSTLAMIGDQATDAPWPQPYLIYRLFLETDAARLRRLLLAHDVKLDKAAVGTWEGRDVFIIGDESGHPSAQVWFDQKNLTLVRLILPGTGGSTGYDIALSDYRTYRPKLLWPHVMTVTTDQGKVEILRLKSLSINPGAETVGFESGNAQTPPTAPDMDEQPPSDPALIKIRKQIEWFQKKLE